MELCDAEEIALGLMKKHRLKGWTFVTNKRKKTLGLCFSRIKRIELSTNFILHNSAEVVTETILHEIAHALVGTKHGHDAVWKAMAEKVGASPTRTTRNVVMPPGQWQAMCGGCGVLFSRYRRPKYDSGHSCRRCGPEIGDLRYRHVSEIMAANQSIVPHLVPSDDLAVAAHTLENSD